MLKVMFGAIKIVTTHKYNNKNNSKVFSRSKILSFLEINQEYNNLVFLNNHLDYNLE